MSTRLLGGPALALAVDRCRTRIDQIGGPKGVVIVRHVGAEASASTPVWAAEVSARAKSRAFRLAGFSVEDVVFGPASNLEQTFPRHVAVWSQDPHVVGLVVQRPFPHEFLDFLKAASGVVDLDGVCGGSVCAAAEAALRFVRGYSIPDLRVAVVGGAGFVGRDVVRGLARDGVSHVVIERTDSLDALRACNAVVTATGILGLIRPGHLGPQHRLVVDVGFSPFAGGRLLAHGDVVPTAIPEGALFTPVPGGIGPLQISILVDRAREALDRIEGT